MPAIAPPDSEDELEEVDFSEIAVLVGPVGNGVIVVVVDALGVGVAVGVDEGATSAGKYCPGLNIKLEFFANANCVSKVSVSFALTTPIMPSSMQAPGAEQ